MSKNAPAGRPRLSAWVDPNIDDDRKNRVLLEWLSDDEDRASLFELVNSSCGGVFTFPSRAGPAEPCCVDDDHPRPPPQTDHRDVLLITDRKRIEAALADGGTEYSSRPYAELGGGNFTLALDPATTGGEQQQAQLDALRHAFPHDAGLIARVAHEACDAAAILSLRRAEFDLAEFAEQAALRFCQLLLGYAPSDHVLLEAALRASYHALVYQVLGRHFATQPMAIPEARQQMGRLVTRTAALIDAYESADDDVLKGCRRPVVPEGPQPVLARLATYRGSLNGEQRAIVAAGAAAGTVGNVQAAVCIAVKALFADADELAKAQALALDPDDPRHLPSQNRTAWRALIAGPLRRDPPIPFLPRVRIVDPGNGRPRTYCEVLLALGGGTATARMPGEDPLIWGLPGVGRHACFGRELAWPLIVEIVRYVMGLPGLAQRLDPEDASVIGLKKRWGFICERYPLLHRRERRVAQATLNVHMRIKAPVKQNADRLRQVIRSGAPRIHEVLRESRHVHFAWFEFVERDTVLVLHTIYDGDFAAYIQHFALRVGDLFDTLFESIEDAPPSPVNKFPNDFVSLIRRYDRAPAMGYFFSAYPRSEAARVARAERARP